MPITSLVFALIYPAGLIAGLTSASAWSFLIYQFVYFTNPQGRWWGNWLPALPYSMITVLVMFIYVLVIQRTESNVRLRALPQTKWIVGLLLLHVAIYPLAVAPDLHHIAFIEFLKLCVVIALAYKILDTPARLRQSLWAYLVGATYIGWEAYSVGRNSNGRVEGIGPVDSPDANGTAAAIVSAVPMILCLLTTGTWRERLVAAACGIWIVNGLVLINSRGSFVAATISSALVLIYIFGSRMQQASQRLSAVLVVMISLGGVFWLADDAFWDRMNTLNEVEDESKSGSSRVRFWMATFDLVDDHPFGVGVKGYNKLSQIYVDPSLLGSDKAQKSVHSTWFQALAETGWLGLFLLVSMLLASFRATRQVRRTAVENNDSHTFWSAVAIEAGLLSYIIAASFLDRYRAEVLFWFVLYTAVLYGRHVLPLKRVETSVSSGVKTDVARGA